jgi:hypothetical protein
VGAFVALILVLFVSGEITRIAIGVALDDEVLDAERGGEGFEAVFDEMPCHGSGFKG